MARKRILLVLIFAMTAFGVVGQPGDPGGGEKPGTVPISGIEVLLALGGALGMKRLFDLRNSKK